MHNLYDEIDNIVDNNALTNVFDALATSIANKIRKCVDPTALKKLKTTHRELEKISKRFESNG